MLIIAKLGLVGQLWASRTRLSWLYPKNVPQKCTPNVPHFITTSVFCSKSSYISLKTAWNSPKMPKYGQNSSKMPEFNSDNHQFYHVPRFSITFSIILQSIRVQLMGYINLNAISLSFSNYPIIFSITVPFNVRVQSMQSAR